MACKAFQKTSFYVGSQSFSVAVKNLRPVRRLGCGLARLRSSFNGNVLLPSVSRGAIKTSLVTENRLSQSSSVLPHRRFCSSAVAEETPRLYTNVAVEVRGSDEAVLDSYCQFVSRAAAVLSFDISGKIILPTHFLKHTLLKSPHIYKKHMAQYEVRTYKRMLQMRNLTGESADTFLEYIQRNLPEGVSMIVEQTELQPLPEYIKAASAAAENVSA